MYPKIHRSPKVIIPLGFDCHPAYILKATNIRKESFPFDWLDTDPLLGLNYAHSNITSGFKFFLQQLSKNDLGKVYSSYYNYSTFYHYDDLIENSKLKELIAARCVNLLRQVSLNACGYLYNISSSSITSYSSMEVFRDSVLQFLNLLKAEDHLYIYVRYDENYFENSLYCLTLLQQLQGLHQLTIIQYLRQTERFGIWGDDKFYFNLLTEIGIIKFLENTGIT